MQQTRVLYKLLLFLLILTFFHGEICASENCGKATNQLHVFVLHPATMLSVEAVPQWESIQ